MSASRMLSGGASEPVELIYDLASNGQTVDLTSFIQEGDLIVVTASGENAAISIPAIDEEPITTVVRAEYSSDDYYFIGYKVCSGSEVSLNLPARSSSFRVVYSVVVFRNAVISDYNIGTYAFGSTINPPSLAGFSSGEVALVGVSGKGAGLLTEYEPGYDLIHNAQNVSPFQLTALNYTPDSSESFSASFDANVQSKPFICRISPAI